MDARWSARIILWAPRVLGIATALFLAVFAADVFDEGLGAWDTLLALLIHLIPSLLLLLVVALSWRWMWIGGVIFTALGVLYAVGNIMRHPEWVAAISGPLVAVGVLYIASWTLHARKLRREKR